MDAQGRVAPHVHQSLLSAPAVEELGAWSEPRYFLQGLEIKVEVIVQEALGRGQRLDALIHT